MKKKEILRHAVLCFTVFLLMISHVYSATDDYQVLKSRFAIDTTRRHAWNPSYAYNPVDDEFIVVWRSAGKLRDDCDPGDMYECASNFQSIDGARISPDAQVLNITVSPPGGPLDDVGYKCMAMVAHNPFRNEYMAIWAQGPENCMMCHEGEEGGNVRPSLCVFCHPLDDPGECNLVNLGEHALANCLDCHDYLNDCVSPPVAPSEHFADCAVCHEMDSIHTRIGHAPASYKNEIYETRLDGAGNVLTTPESIWPVIANASFPVIVFNTVRKQYLVVYGEKFVYSDYYNNIGVILDEDGDIVKEPFRADTGDMGCFIYYLAYNPDDDQYMVNWEDERHADDPSKIWMGPQSIFGCLLDGDGNMIADFPTMEYTVPEEGSMYYNPFQVYNPDRNEYLVSWVDTRPSLEDGNGIYGRFIDTDGTFRGEPFAIVDGPQAQGYEEMVYVPKEKKYFLVWSDSRNYIPAPDDPPWIAENDIYATWLDDETGLPVGDEIPIYVGEGDQTAPLVGYSPVSDKLLIAWWEVNVPNDYELIPGEGLGQLGPTTGDWGMPQFLPESGDIRGAIYGIPSFLTGHVIEKGTGDPVEGARVIVFGPSLPVLKTTNEGGWFNISKDSQRAGKYLVVVLKFGYPLKIQLVNYTGESLRETIEMNKWW